MLHQDLPTIESTALDGWGRWLAPALIVGAAASAAVLLLMAGQPLAAAVVALLGLAAAAFVSARSPSLPVPSEPLLLGPDYALL